MGVWFRIVGDGRRGLVGKNEVWGLVGRRVGLGNGLFIYLVLGRRGYIFLEVV